MPRRDPRFVATDVIRVFEKNLDLANKRLVIAWFFSLIPVEEPKVDALQILLDFFSLIPIAGRFADLFQISLATAQAAKDIAELFGFEFEEEEVELARLRFELETLTEEFRKQREELRLTRLELDREREQANALRATIELLEDEIRDLSAQPPSIPANVRDIVVELVPRWQVVSSDLTTNRSRVGNILFLTYREQGRIDLLMGRLSNASTSP